jgi:hypothetical protein
VRRALLLASLCALGCGPSFDPISFVDKLRVLGIKAEPPELKPGESAQLSVLLGSAGLDAGMVDLEWATCLRPPPVGSGTAVNDDCVTNDTAPYLTPIGAGETATVTMPNVPPLSLGLPDATGGLYLPVRLTARAGDAKVTSFYLLRYGFGINPNHNPKLDNVFVATGSPDLGEGPDAGDGALMLTPLDEKVPFEVHAGDKIRLRATVTPDSDEMFQELQGDPRDMMFITVTELPRFAWFLTAGEVSEDITGEDKPDTMLDFEKHAPAPDTLIDVYVVVHDDRGGTDWTHRTLVFR